MPCGTLSRRVVLSQATDRLVVLSLADEQATITIQELAMLELTREQHQALQTAESPPRVRDPETNTTYVLLPAEVYENLRDQENLDEVRLMEFYLAEMNLENWEDAANYEKK